MQQLIYSQKYFALTRKYILISSKVGLGPTWSLPILDANNLKTFLGNDAFIYKAMEPITLSLV